MNIRKPYNVFFDGSSSATLASASSIHVLKGKTSLLSGPENNQKNVLVNSISANRISSNLQVPVDIAFNERMLVRQIDIQIDPSVRFWALPENKRQPREEKIFF